MGSYNILEKIKEKFTKYETYYEILGVKPNSVTDEKVKYSYDNKCMQLDEMLKSCKSESIQEIRELIQTTLDDAYTALKTEDSRRNYNELLKTISTSSESIEKKDEENQL